MKYLAGLTMIILLVSCNSINSIFVDRKNKKKIEALYGPDIWSTYFKTKTTPRGRTIRLKIINDNFYQVQWGISPNLKTYPQLFMLDGHETWIPSYIDENSDFIVLRQGCGSPCWIRYFLPLSDSLKTYVFNEYFEYDLNDNLVAYPGESYIGITNISTNVSESHQIGKCDAAFIGACIDSLSIKDKILKYKWLPNNFTDLTDAKWIIEKIKI